MLRREEDPSESPSVLRRCLDRGDKLQPSPARQISAPSQMLPAVALINFTSIRVIPALTSRLLTNILITRPVIL